MLVLIGLSLACLFVFDEILRRRNLSSRGDRNIINFLKTTHNFQRGGLGGHRARNCIFRVRWRSISSLDLDL